MPSKDVQVEIFVAGDGKNYPKDGDTVTIEYTAYLLLDSKRKQFDTVSLSRLILKFARFPLNYN